MSTIIEMPKLSDTMTVGTVVKWYKQVGEEVANGDTLAEIETDKATMELENFEDGILLQLLVDEGDEVEIGKPLAIVGQAGETLPLLENLEEKTDGSDDAIDSSEEIASEEDLLSTSETSSPDLPTKTVEKSADGDRVLASPLAKKIAKENGIDLSSIKGSGPRGRITKKDLTPLDKSQGSNLGTNNQPTDTTSFSSAPALAELKSKSVPVSKMRSVIAKRLLDSKTSIPHFYLQKEINSQPLRLARESINRRLGMNPSNSVKVSINDMILLSCARAIPQVPEINTSWAENEILFHGEVHLAFGVAVNDGLVTPVIKNADCMDLSSISNEAKSLIQKSRDKKLSPDDMSGSTFTVTNLGMFGIDFFSGIINPPNAAILAVGASVVKPVVAKDGTVCSGETMTLGLSCDHRLVDGAVGARFLQVLAELLENPASMLV